MYRDALKLKSVVAITLRNNQSSEFSQGYKKTKNRFKSDSSLTSSYGITFSYILTPKSVMDL